MPKRTLGSVSMFMKYLKQLIAYRANREDSRTGHFFEGRFHLGAILGEDGLIAAMAYVDLNPVRAKIVASFEQYEETSARLRLTRNTARSLKQAIKPLYSGIKLARPALSFSMQDYFNILSTAYNDYQNPDVGDRESRWSASDRLLWQEATCLWQRRGAQSICTGTQLGSCGDTFVLFVTNTERKCLF